VKTTTKIENCFKPKRHLERGPGFRSPTLKKLLLQCGSKWLVKAAGAWIATGRARIDPLVGLEALHTPFTVGRREHLPPFERSSTYMLSAIFHADAVPGFVTDLCRSGDGSRVRRQQQRCTRVYCNRPW
jgi:hypothetical protein